MRTLCTTTYIVVQLTFLYICIILERFQFSFSPAQRPPDCIDSDYAHDVVIIFVTKCAVRNLTERGYGVSVILSSMVRFSRCVCICASCSAISNGRFKYSRVIIVIESEKWVLCVFHAVRENRYTRLYERSQFERYTCFMRRQVLVRPMVPMEAYKIPTGHIVELNMLEILDAGRLPEGTEVSRNCYTETVLSTLTTVGTNVCSTISRPM